MAAIRTSFGEILKAIKNKLIADAVVKDPTQIIWAVNNNVPQFIGDFDIVMRAMSGYRLYTDGGSWDFRWSRQVRISIRSQSIRDLGADNEAWVTAQFILADQIIDSVAKDSFTPKDNLGRNLTTKSIEAIMDDGPERQNDDGAWGMWVCTLECHYLCDVDPTTK